MYESMEVNSNNQIPPYFSVDKKGKLLRTDKKGSLYSIAKMITSFENIETRDLERLREAFQKKFKSNKGLSIIRSIRRKLFDRSTGLFQERLNTEIQERAQQRKAKAKLQRDQTIEALNSAKTEALGGNFIPLLELCSKAFCSLTGNEKELLSLYLKNAYSNDKRTGVDERTGVIEKIVKGNAHDVIFELLRRQELHETFPQLILNTPCFINLVSFEKYSEERVQEALSLLQSTTAAVGDLETFIQSPDFKELENDTSKKRLDVLAGYVRAKYALLSKSVQNKSWYSKLLHEKSFEITEDGITYEYQVSDRGITPKKESITSRLVLVSSLILFNDWKRIGKVFSVAAISDGELKDQDITLLKRMAELDVEDNTAAASTALRAFYILMSKGLIEEKDKEKITHALDSYEKNKKRGFLLESYELQALRAFIGKDQTANTSKKSLPSKERKSSVNGESRGKELKAQEIHKKVQPYQVEFQKRSEGSLKLEGKSQVKAAYDHFLQTANEIYTKQDRAQESFEAPKAYSELLNHLADKDLFLKSLEGIESTFQKDYDTKFVELFALLPENPPALDQILIYYAQGRVGEVLKLQDEQKFQDEQKIAGINKTIQELLSRKQELQKCERIRDAVQQKGLDKGCKDLITAQRCYTDEEALKKPYLQVFEVFLGVFARDKQIEVIEKLADADSKAVVQLLMGSGKTFLLLPLLGFIRADGDHIASLMIPDELFNDQINSLKSTLGVTFGSSVYQFPDLKPEVTKEELDSIFAKLEFIRDSRGVVATTPQRKHALLNLLPILLQKGNEPGNIEKLQALVRILRILAECESSLGDEVDTLLKTTLQFIITQGDGAPYNQKWAQAIADLSLHAIYNVCPKGFLVKEEDFWTSSRDALAPVSQLVEFTKNNLVKDLPSSECIDTILSVRKKTDENKKACREAEEYINKLKPDQRKYLLALRTAIQTVIPQALTSYYNSEYGVRKDPKDPIACPFQGPDCPTKTQFSSPIEQIVRSIFALKLKGAEENALRENALSDLLAKVVVYPARVASTAQKLFSSASSFSGFTATTWNASTFPAFDNIFPDTEQEVEALLNLGEKAERGEITFQKKASGKSAKAELIDQITRGENPPVCLIDTGGWLRDTSIQQFIKDIFEARQDIESIVYHDENGQLKRQLKDGKIEDFHSDASDDPSKRFTIYQQQYVTGTDIKQAPTGCGLLTAWNKMILRDAQQSIFRLRQIMQDQSCSILYDDEFDTSMASTIEEHTVGEEITFQRFLRYLMTSQEMKRIQENYSAVHQRMKDVLEKKVRDFILEKGVTAESPKDFNAIFDAFEKAKWLFVENEDDVGSTNWEFPKDVLREERLKKDVESYEERFKSILTDLGMSETEVKVLLNNCYDLEDLDERLEMASSESEKLTSQIGQHVFIQNHVASVNISVQEAALAVEPHSISQETEERLQSNTNAELEDLTNSSAIQTANDHAIPINQITQENPLNVLEAVELESEEIVHQQVEESTDAQNDKGLANNNELELSQEADLDEDLQVELDEIAIPETNQVEIEQVTRRKEALKAQFEENIKEAAKLHEEYAALTKTASELGIESISSEAIQRAETQLKAIQEDFSKELRLLDLNQVEQSLNTFKTQLENVKSDIARLRDLCADKENEVRNENTQEVQKLSKADNLIHLEVEDLDDLLDRRREVSELTLVQSNIESLKEDTHNHLLSSIEQKIDQATILENDFGKEVERAKLLDIETPDQEKTRTALQILNNSLSTVQNGDLSVVESIQNEIAQADEYIDSAQEQLEQLKAQCEVKERLEEISMKKSLGELLQQYHKLGLDVSEVEDVIEEVSYSTNNRSMLLNSIQKFQKNAELRQQAIQEQKETLDRLIQEHRLILSKDSSAVGFKEIHEEAIQNFTQLLKLLDDPTERKKFQELTERIAQKTEEFSISKCQERIKEINSRFKKSIKELNQLKKHVQDARTRINGLSSIASRLNCEREEIDKLQNLLDVLERSEDFKEPSNPKELDRLETFLRDESVELTSSLESDIQHITDRLHKTLNQKYESSKEEAKNLFEELNLKKDPNLFAQPPKLERKSEAKWLERITAIEGAVESLKKYRANVERLKALQNSSDIESKRQAASSVLQHLPKTYNETHEINISELINDIEISSDVRDLAREKETLEKSITLLPKNQELEALQKNLSKAEKRLHTSEASTPKDALSWVRKVRDEISQLLEKGQRLAQEIEIKRIEEKKGNLRPEKDDLIRKVDSLSEDYKNELLRAHELEVSYGDTPQLGDIKNKIAQLDIESLTSLETLESIQKEIREISDSVVEASQALEGIKQKNDEKEKEVKSSLLNECAELTSLATDVGLPLKFNEEVVTEISQIRKWIESAREQIKKRQEHIQQDERVIQDLNQRLNSLEDLSQNLFYTEITDRARNHLKSLEQKLSKPQDLLQYDLIHQEILHAEILYSESLVRTKILESTQQLSKISSEIERAQSLLQEIEKQEADLEKINKELGFASKSLSGRIQETQKELSNLSRKPSYESFSEVQEKINTCIETASQLKKSAQDRQEIIYSSIREESISLSQELREKSISLHLQPDQILDKTPSHIKEAAEHLLELRKMSQSLLAYEQNINRLNALLESPQEVKKISAQSLLKHMPSTYEEVIAQQQSIATVISKIEKETSQRNITAEAEDVLAKLDRYPEFDSSQIRHDIEIARKRFESISASTLEETRLEIKKAYVSFISLLEKAGKAFDLWINSQLQNDQKRVFEAVQKELKDIREFEQEFEEISNRAKALGISSSLLPQAGIGSLFSSFFGRRDLSVPEQLQNITKDLLNIEKTSQTLNGLEATKRALKEVDALRVQLSNIKNSVDTLKSECDTKESQKRENILLKLDSLKKEFLSLGLTPQDIENTRPATTEIALSLSTIEEEIKELQLKAEKRQEAITAEKRKLEAILSDSLFADKSEIRDQFSYNEVTSSAQESIRGLLKEFETSESLKDFSSLQEKSKNIQMTLAPKRLKESIQQNHNRYTEFLKRKEDLQQKVDALQKKQQDLSKALTYINSETKDLLLAEQKAKELKEELQKFSAPNDLHSLEMAEKELDEIQRGAYLELDQKVTGISKEIERSCKEQMNTLQKRAESLCRKAHIQNLSLSSLPQEFSGFEEQWTETLQKSASVCKILDTFVTQINQLETLKSGTEAQSQISDAIMKLLPATYEERLEGSSDIENALKYLTSMSDMRAFKSQEETLETQWNKYPEYNAQQSREKIRKIKDELTKSDRTSFEEAIQHVEKLRDEEERFLKEAQSHLQRWKKEGLNEFNQDVTRALDRVSKLEEEAKTLSSRASALNFESGIDSSYKTIRAQITSLQTEEFDDIKSSRKTLLEREGDLDELQRKLNDFHNKCNEREHEIHVELRKRAENDLEHMKNLGLTSEELHAFIERSSFSISEKVGIEKMLSHVEDQIIKSQSDRNKLLESYSQDLQSFEEISQSSKNEAVQQFAQALKGCLPKSDEEILIKREAFRKALDEIESSQDERDLTSEIQDFNEKVAKETRYTKAQLYKEKIENVLKLFDVSSTATIETAIDLVRKARENVARTLEEAENDFALWCEETLRQDTKLVEEAINECNQVIKNLTETLEKEKVRAANLGLTISLPSKLLDEAGTILQNKGQESLESRQKDILKCRLVLKNAAEKLDKISSEINRVEEERIKTLQSQMKGLLDECTTFGIDSSSFSNLMNELSHENIQAREQEIETIKQQVDDRKESIGSFQQRIKLQIDEYGSESFEKMQSDFSYQEVTLQACEKLKALSSRLSDKKELINFDAFSKEIETALFENSAASLGKSIQGNHARYTKQSIDKKKLSEGTETLRNQVHSISVLAENLEGSSYSSEEILEDISSLSNQLDSLSTPVTVNDLEKLENELQLARQKLNELQKRVQASELQVCDELGKTRSSLLNDLNEKCEELHIEPLKIDSSSSEKTALPSDIQKLRTELEKVSEFEKRLNRLKNFEESGSEAQRQLALNVKRALPKTLDDIERTSKDLNLVLAYISSNNDSRKLEHEEGLLRASWRLHPSYSFVKAEKSINEAKSSLISSDASTLLEEYRRAVSDREKLSHALTSAEKDFSDWKKETLSKGQSEIMAEIQKKREEISKNEADYQLLYNRALKLQLSFSRELKGAEEIHKELASIESELSKSIEESQLTKLRERIGNLKDQFEEALQYNLETERQCSKKEEEILSSLIVKKSNIEKEAKDFGISSEKLEKLKKVTASNYDEAIQLPSLIEAVESEIQERKSAIKKVKTELQELKEGFSSLSDLEGRFSYTELLHEAQESIKEIERSLNDSQSLLDFASLDKKAHNYLTEYSSDSLRTRIEKNSERLEGLIEERKQLLERIHVEKERHEEAQELIKLINGDASIRQETLAQLSSLSSQLEQLVEPQSVQGMNEFGEKISNVFEKSFLSLQDVSKVQQQLLEKSVKEREAEYIAEIAKLGNKTGVTTPSYAFLDVDIQDSANTWTEHLKALQSDLSTLNEIQEHLSTLEAISLEVSLEAFTMKDAPVSLKSQVVTSLGNGIPRACKDLQNVNTYLNEALQEWERIKSERDDLEDLPFQLNNAFSLEGFSHELIQEISLGMENLKNSKNNIGSPSEIVQSVILERKELHQKGVDLQKAIDSWKENQALLAVKKCREGIENLQSSIGTSFKGIEDLAGRLDHINKVDDANIKNNASELKNELLLGLEKYNSRMDELTRAYSEMKSDVSLERIEKLYMEMKEFSESVSSLHDLNAQKISSFENKFKLWASETLQKMIHSAQQIGLELSIPRKYATQEYTADSFKDVYNYLKQLHILVKERSEKIESQKRSLVSLDKDLRYYNELSQGGTGGIVNSLWFFITQSAIEEIESVRRDLENPESLKAFDKCNQKADEILRRFSVENIQSIVGELVQEINEVSHAAQEASSQASKEIETESRFREHFKNSQAHAAVEDCNEAKKSLDSALKQFGQFVPQKGNARVEDQARKRVRELVTKIRKETSNLEVATQSLKEKTLGIRNEFHKQKTLLERQIKGTSQKTGLSIPSDFQSIITSFPKNIRGHEASWKQSFDDLIKCRDLLLAQVQQKALRDTESQNAIAKIEQIDEKFEEWKSEAIQNDPTGSVQEFFEGRESLSHVFKMRCASEGNPNAIADEYLQEVKLLSEQALEAKNDHLNIVNQMRAALEQCQNKLETVSSWSGGASLLKDVFNEFHLALEYENLISSLDDISSDLKEGLQEGGSMPLSKLSSQFEKTTQRLREVEARIDPLYKELMETYSSKKKETLEDVQSLQNGAKRWRLDIKKAEEVIHQFQGVPFEDAESFTKELDDALLTLRVARQLHDTWSSRFDMLKETLSLKILKKLSDVGQLITQLDFNKDSWGGVELALLHQRVSLYQKAQLEEIETLATSNDDIESYGISLDETLAEFDISTKKLIDNLRLTRNEIVLLEADYSSFLTLYGVQIQNIATDIREPLIQARNSLDADLSNVLAHYSSQESDLYAVLQNRLSELQAQKTKLQNVHQSQKIYIGALSKLFGLAQLPWPPKFKQFVDFTNPIVRQRAMKLFEEHQVTNEAQLMTIWLVDLLKGIGSLENYSIQDIGHIRWFMNQFFATHSYSYLLLVDLHAPGKDLARLSTAQVQEDGVVMKLQEAFDVMCAESIFNRLKSDNVLQWEEPGKIKWVIEDIQRQCGIRGRPLCIGSDHVEFVADKLIDIRGESMDFSVDD